jgi:hypothetical protein
MLDTSKVDINKAQLLTVLQLHVGREQGIHIRDLVARITGSLLGGDADERKVRKLIEELRMEKHPICAHPDTGYYIAANKRELDETCAFLLARTSTTVAQVAAMKNREAPDLYDALGVGRRKASPNEERDCQ